MALSGDFAGLGQLARNVERLARVPSRAAALAAPGIAREIAGEFAAGRDPYGRAWAPLRPSTQARGRRPPPLTDTGKMRAGVDVRPLPGAGIAITFADEIPAYFHNRGTRKMVRREILPVSAFPARWARVLERAGDEAVARTMEGR